MDSIIVCTGPPMLELAREPHGDPRWCFQCRKQVPFEYVVSAPVEPSYYGPSFAVECAPQGHYDGDLFPGRSREWEG